MLVVLTTLAATILIQLGLFLWKLSADGQPRIGDASALVVARALFGDWRWVLGFAATSVGWVLFVQATALGDISLVQPLMSSGDLMLVIMAVVFLKERLSGMEWLGVLLTVLGALALALVAEDTQVTAYMGGRLIVLLGLVLLLAVALLLANRRAQRPEVLLAVVVGLCFGAGSVLTKALTAESTGPGQSVMTWGVVLNPLLMAVVLANLAGLVLLQAAFQRGRAAVVVPLQLALANCVTVLGGVLVFAEHITLLRGLGIVLIVVGTTLLQFKPASNPPHPA
jgi:uncharacterized membrane protein